MTFGVLIYLVSKDNSCENNREYRYVLVIIENFTKFSWTKPLKNKNGQTIKDSFGNILKSSEKNKFNRTDCGKEFYNNIYQNFLNNNNIKYYSRKRSYGAVFAERFNLTIRNLLKRPVFEGDGNWIQMLPTITKQKKILHYSHRLS